MRRELRGLFKCVFRRSGQGGTEFRAQRGRADAWNCYAQTGKAGHGSESDLYGTSQSGGILLYGKRKEGDVRGGRAAFGERRGRAGLRLSA